MDQTQEQETLLKAQEPQINDSMDRPGRWVTFKTKYGNRRFYNVLMLGFSFMTVFTAFNTTQGYMTTFHEKAGFWSLCVLYIFFAFSNLISPVVVSRLGPRMGLFLGAIPYAIFVLAACFTSDAALIITAGVLGIGAAILWTAHGTFLTQCAGNDMGFYSGVFFGIFQMNGILGSLIAASLLQVGLDQFWTFFILFVIAVIGVIMLCYLLPIQTHQVSSVEQTESLSMILRSTFAVLLDKRMILFIPISLFSGFSMSLYLGLIPPIIGVKYLGWVLALFGVAEVLGSIIFGKWADLLGKRPVMLTTYAIHASALVCSFFIYSAQPYMFFVTMFFAGLGDAGLNTSIYAILGSANYFKSQAAYAFAAFKLIQSIAMAAGFFSGIYLTYQVIQIIICSIWGAAVLFFVILDFFIAPSDKKFVEDLE
jgi:MFS family permease